MTISISSQVDINNFQFQLSHTQSSNLEMVPQFIERQLTPFKYEDLDNNNIYSYEGFSEDSEKYIKDVSLYSLPSLDDTQSDGILISYGYGMQAELNFAHEPPDYGLNQFLYDNDETIFLSHEQTRLVIYFDLSSDIYQIPEDGLLLKITGNIGTVLVEDFINPNPIMIDDDTDRASIIIGPLIDELLLSSNELFDDSDDIPNAISKHITLSIDSNSDTFSILKIMSDENHLPHIDVFYSE